MNDRFSDSEQDTGFDDLPEFRLLAGLLSESPELLDTVPATPEGIAPASLFVPTGYEPNYAYPLVVWLKGPDGCALDFQHLMPVISDRNYLGLEIDATEAIGNNLDLLNESTDNPEAPTPLMALEFLVEWKVRQLRLAYNIHTERVFLAGFGDGGTLALQLGLARPEWFAGIVAVSSRFPATRSTLRRFRDLLKKRVLLCCGSQSRRVTPAQTLETSRLLHSAGMRVCTRMHDAGHQITRTMLLEIDRWIMQEILQPQPV